MNAIAKTEEQVPAVVAPSMAATMMEIINRAAFDESVDADKVEKLLEMALKVRAADAKAAFTAALVKMKPMLPVIDRKGRIEVREKTSSGKRDGDIQQSTSFARWEDIDAAITPILAAHGFVLTFRTGNLPDGRVTVTGILSHELGHSEDSEMALPLDTTGSKNNAQAAGSSTSYGKRYTATALLNIRTKGEDDDGQAGGDPGSISEEQAERLLEMLTRDKADVAGFCKYMKIDSLIELPAARYDEAIFLINTRAAQAAKKKAASQ